ncbi:DUF5365 family protein [Bacillus sp. FJAT-47783]|uniref:DUF5365 family protein n=1 Tax=Bacillus sp. FJAT-47783 TaxID=2922712 RepID=UPI001FACEBE3|nr:DUF5365 family protein [Bacillus sp. FJAT-47783]
MKIVVASTEEQEKYIEELVQQMFTEIFPMYFPDKKVEELEEMSVLKPDDSADYNGTLKEAFQIMSSLQALIALLENVQEAERNKEKYREMFEKNLRTLEQYGYKFPLSYDQFLSVSTREEVFSRYIKPANKWII